MKSQVRTNHRWTAVLGIASLLFFLGIAQPNPAVGSAHTKASSARVTATDNAEKELAARALGGAPAEEPAALEPPTGTEVDETVQISKQGGETISRTRSWNEQLDGDNILHVELTSFPSRQSQVGFWLLHRSEPGCAIFGRTMYDENGRVLKSEFWRNDRALRITGAANFPSDLYPEAVPAIALPRALDAMRDGATGKINQQITPYGYVDLNVTIKDTEQLKVPAGKFAAFRVSSQPNVATIPPSWPHFLLSVVTPFVPRTTYYFEARPPYRMLRKEQEGTPFIGGPEATTELVRYYIAGATASAAPADPENRDINARR